MGHALYANRPELVIWSSMWIGVWMMSRWSIEFGFYIAGVFSSDGSFIGLDGRPISYLPRWTNGTVGIAPLSIAALDLDLRVVDHDSNYWSRPCGIRAL